MTDSQDPGLALVVGAARSGTTLVRLLLDAHPEMVCPSEAGLPALMAKMATVWSAMGAKVNGGEAPGGGAGGAGALSDPAREWIRASVLHVTRRCCEPGETHLYVDKSLDSVQDLGLVQKVFPESRYVLVFRHVMDTIASGLEASPWGFRGYGYAPYVQASPTNTVAALAKYWLDHVNLALKWERQHPDSCLRVRYEDLVNNPQPEVRRIQRFLRVQEDMSVLEGAFALKPTGGAGDYKIEHTAGIHTRSVGNGRRVPVGLLSTSLRGSLNSRLKELGYPTLSSSWNRSTQAGAAAADDIWVQRLEELMAQAVLPTGDAQEVPAFAVVADDHPAARWIVDSVAGTIVAGDGDVQTFLVGTVADLVQLATGEENLGVLWRTGRIRYVAAGERATDEGDELVKLSAIVEVLHARVAVGGSER